MFDFIVDNWSDLLLSFVGLSALFVYFMQKRDEVRSAATLILGQIDSIERSVAALKDDYQLGNVAVYHSKPIIRGNTWEQYKHLFAKGLSRSEYDMVQHFFDHTEQLERARLDIISTITTGWKDKSSTEHKVVADMIVHQTPDTEFLAFQSQFRPLELVFTPDIVINSLTKSLSNFAPLSGTTAYQKIHKHSYSK